MQELVLKSDDFLVSQTDDKGIILFANDDFCKIAGYTIDELVGKPHNIVRHRDMPKAAFKDLWDTVKSGKVWDGYVKNKTKDGGYYWVYATVYPMKDTITNQTRYMSCRRKPSKQEIEAAETLYKTLR
ncbi:protein containing PAS/PAC domain [Sulfurimonas gotlandica GD1]|jgi:PAS domain S-box-containing protein|uniref:Protein containing PAS/PAC domain n=1 Tax=Sulfurimonas gotlandica (strain DSM 19862 / JCM 16533 / GD1) TaxID=929558 RepID=B6BJB5_SULGG|nr:PAS sensor domain-containing protein [Sulfurimonas gotlandica]EDZ63708.1 methyl-accepting chemotaxis sensory transducer with Pas/Pac sensor [Sulfurimonas gotlandica GD1]EHP30636.1 protein containing PAS/PAC domain [Sulfurimonas gotlandica GD1]